MEKLFDSLKLTWSRLIIWAVITAAALGLCACSTPVNTSDSTSVSESKTSEHSRDQNPIPHRYATAEEGRELMLSNTEYYANFTQNDLDYKLQQVDAQMDAYQEFAAQQTEDFTEAEIQYLDSRIAHMEEVLEENGYELPPLDEIVLIKTTMNEESGAAAYTHGTQIYLGSTIISVGTTMSNDPEVTNDVEEILWHELFHCLTRCNPDFREDMYSLIHFTVADSDFQLPPSVLEYHITNPDVEHHDAYATFYINGENIDCFTDFVTTKHYAEVHTDFFEYSTTALIPVDGTDTYYTPEDASNFDEVFGTNTDYVIDPEECLADNFAFAMTYGLAGRDGQGYPNPEIIQGIIDYLER